MLGVAGLAFGSYCAYADNSATMTVTATIAHDVSLKTTGDINLGTITVNPAYTGWTDWQYSDSGVVSYINKGAIISAPDITVGTFTANISNPEACSTANDYCGGLYLESDNGDDFLSLFTESGSDSACFFYIKYSGDGNNFKVYPRNCTIYDISKVTPDRHTGTLIINYNAS